MVDLQFADLRECPWLLGQIAGWHEAESGGAVTQSQAEARLRRHLGSERLPSTLVALDQSDQLVGAISMVTYARLAGGEASVWLANLFVQPAWRCLGVGDTLLTQALTRIRLNDRSPVYLFTTDLEAYYLKRGWKPVRRGTFRQQAAVVMRYSD